MNGYNFTERVRKVLQVAREEALALHHEYVGTEHMLLGLVGGGGVAEATMTNLGVDLARLREAVLNVVKPGTGNGGMTGLPAPGGLLGAITGSMGMRKNVDLPYTSRAKKVLELSMMEARELRHSYVGTEHLLLGLMREERGIGAQVLTSMGLTIAGVREEVLRLLGTELPPDPKPMAADRPHTRPEEREAAITLVVEHPDGRIEAKKFRRANEAVSFLNGLEY